MGKQPMTDWPRTGIGIGTEMDHSRGEHGPGRATSPKLVNIKHLLDKLENRILQEFKSILLSEREGSSQMTNSDDTRANATEQIRGFDPHRDIGGDFKLRAELPVSPEDRVYRVYLDEESQEESREKEDGHAHKDSGEVEDNNYVAVGVTEAEEYGYVPAVTSDAEYYCTDKDTDAYKSDDGYDGDNGYDGYGSDDEFDNNEGNGGDEQKLNDEVFWWDGFLLDRTGGNGSVPRETGKICSEINTCLNRGRYALAADLLVGDLGQGSNATSDRSLNGQVRLFGCWKSQDGHARERTVMMVDVNCNNGGQGAGHATLNDIFFALTRISARWRKEIWDTKVTKLRQWSTVCTELLGKYGWWGQTGVKSSIVRKSTRWRCPNADSKASEIVRCMTRWRNATMLWLGSFFRSMVTYTTI